MANSGGFVVNTHDFTLVRSGRTYSGIWESDDGGVLTSWRDYYRVAVEITDTNDEDGNGIPDFSDNLPTKFKHIAVMPGSQIQLELQGQAGKDVTVFTSTDLTNWLPWVALPNSQGSLKIFDAITKGSGKRFYSVR
jgi:hypothetical protein